MYKNGCIVYFSGTGNSEHVAKLLKSEFEQNNINIDLINVEKEKRLDKQYDFYAFGGPIYAGMIPAILTDWIKENVNDTNKDCIVYSTLAADNDTGGRIYVGKLLAKKGFNIVVNTSVSMPNNYYFSFFKKDTEESHINKKENAKIKAKNIVEDFLNKADISENLNKNTLMHNVVYSCFNTFAKGYAKKNFSLEKESCINCKKCERCCPTQNVKLENKTLSFDKKCISCMRCIHICPKNAILYKGNKIEQYKL